MIALAELPDPVITAMRNHVAALWPREACGVVFDVMQDHYEAYACHNVAKNAEHRFQVSAHDLFVIGTCLKHGDRLVAIYHSHVDRPGIFSELDREYARGYPDALHIVFAVTEKGVIAQHAYRADGTCLDEPVKETA